MSNTPFQNFLQYTYPDILTGAGTLGNVVTFLIFFRKRFNKTPISVTFRAMTIVNTIMLWEFCYCSLRLVISPIIHLLTFFCLSYFNFAPSDSARLLVFASLLMSPCHHSQPGVNTYIRES